jgi:hypothetical protein
MEAILYRFQIGEEVDRLPIKRTINAFGFQSLIVASVIKFPYHNQFQSFPSLLRFPPSAISRVMWTGARGDTAWSRVGVGTGTGSVVGRRCGRVGQPGRCGREKEKGCCPHGLGGSRQLGPEAFSPEANKNLKYLAILFVFHSNGFSLTSKNF